MNAITIAKPGDPDVLTLKPWPMPSPADHEVLVKVASAGVNRPDVYQRKGNYPPPPGASEIPGLEIAGTVVAVGAKVVRWKVGDKVCALVAGGGYAEYCVVPEGQCLPVPTPLSMAEAASLPETFFTVWSNVFERGRLKPGETLLVHGGSSGIGVTAIQLAKAWGATVYITAGSADKCAACIALGANHAINYKTEKFGDVVKSITNKKGVDVILDMIGGDYTAINLDILADEGRLVLINTMGGDETNVKLSQIMRKRLTVTGSTLRARDTAFKTAVAQSLEKHVWPWLESGRVKPIVYKTFPLQNAADAHRLMETSEHIGKIVLTVE
ncbi:NAD(P)H-quinone oxidoreductase [Chryseolinea lacunae]|uniref:NAD(P)H-quinone oxidoreductase n=1 Tax=Chryseolinea lacunae TaxID=2801331 RepID=A0ABS1KUH1_9BACT|nr:NAD(P)H-quinone oxidoreductase [Chryseolinea lacunae]MBL0743125.1 NAD(P)H-quinone oxidoreductase [Chryseolinea lacunae]